MDLESFTNETHPHTHQTLKSNTSVKKNTLDTGEASKKIN